MTLIEQIRAQKALMESKGAIGLRVEMGVGALRDLSVAGEVGDWNTLGNGRTTVLGMPAKLEPGMEGFAILATWPENG